MSFGLQDALFDVRGRGNAMLLDLAHAESPWGEIGNAWFSVVRVEQGPAGLRGSYHTDGLEIEAGILQIDAGQGVSGLERVAYADAVFDLDEFNGRIGVIAALFSGPGKGESVITLGGAFCFQLTSEIELFGELYFQTGTAVSQGETTLDGIGPFGQDADAAGVAWVVGGLLKAEGPTETWVELSVISISGFEQSTVSLAATSGVSGGNLATNVDETAEFLSYENNDDMLILDSNEWGFDIDNNIVQIKVKSGMAISTGRSIPHDLRLVGKLALADTVEDFVVTDGVLTTEDAWGIEFDARIEYLLNRNAVIHLTFAYLFGSDVMEHFNDEDEDSMILFLLGTTATF
jgi:hypothetical protein